MSFSAGQIELQVIATDLTQGTLRQVEANLAAFEGRAQSMLYRLSGMSAATAGVTAIGVAFGVAARQAATVEQNVANLNAALRATPQQLASIRGVGLTLSQQTQFTDAQILQGQRVLAKGNTAPATLADPGFNRNVLNLASATFSEPTQAAQLYIATQKAFQRSNQDSADTVDILSQAVESSIASVGDFQTAMKQIGPVANSAHESLRETAAAVVDLQNAGLSGDTGTAIRTVLARIEAPSKAAKASIDELGLSFYTAGGQLKSYAAIADELRLKTAGMTDEQKNAALQPIFGQRGIRAADILAQEGGQGIRDSLSEMASKGSAADIANEKLNTLEGSAHKLSSSINVLAVQGGQGLIPMLRGATDAATTAANALSTLNQHTANLGGQGLTGGVAIGAEVIAARQLSNFIQSRRDQAAAPGIRAATAQSAASAASIAQQRSAEIDYSQAVAKAQFTADAAIASSHAEMIAKLDALDAAHTERVIASYYAQAAAIQKVYEEQAIAAAESAAKQELAFAKEGALLDVNQGAARQQLALRQTSGGYSAETQLAREQELERATLTDRQAVKAEFDAKYAEIEEQSAQRRVAAINKAGDEELAALRQRAAMTRTAIAEASTTQIAAARAAEANSLASSEESVIAARVASEQRAAAATRATAVPTTISTAAVTAQKGRIATAVGGAGAVIGEVALPLLIALTAKEILVDPLVRAIEEKLAGDQFKNMQAAIAVNLQLAPGSSTEFQEALLAKTRKDIADSRAEIDAYENRQKAGVNKDLSPSNILDRLRPSFLPRVPSGQGAIDETAPGGSKTRYDQAVATLKQAQDAQKSIEQSIANSPGKALNDQVTRIEELSRAVQSGKMSAEDAERAFRTTTISGGAYGEIISNVADDLLRAGASQKQINDLLDQADRRFTQDAKSAREAAIAQAEFVRTQTEQAEALRKLNVPEGVIQGAVYKKGTPEEIVQAEAVAKDYEARDKAATDFWNKENQRIQQARTEYDTLTQQSLSKVASITNSIDLSKGIDSIASSATELHRVHAELAALGQSNSQLDAIAALADNFKAVADAEKEAESSLRAYLLTISQSDKFLGQLGTVEKQLSDAIDAALRAQQMGRATAAQQQLIANAPGYFGQLKGQESSLYATRAQDINELFANGIPNYSQIDQEFRASLQKAGGAQAVEIQLKANTDAINQALDAITLKKYTLTFVTAFEPVLPMGYGPGSVRLGSGQTPTGGVQYPGGSGGGSLGYQPLAESDYNKIVGSYGGSPFAGKYAPFMAAAQRAGVDPRLMLETARFENSFGTDINPSLAAANNYGGIKYSRGVNEDSGIAADNGGDYARYNSPEDFFAALAKNLSTGDYASDFASGNAEAIRRRYVTGGGPGSDAQEQNIKNFLAGYQADRSLYPARAGATDMGGPGDPGYMGGNVGEPGSGPYREGSVSNGRWVLPVTGYTVTQGPFSGAGNSHESLGAYDLAVPTGTPVRSVGAGQVVESGYSNAGYGNTEVIDYGGGIRARYGHLSDLEGTKVGQQVTAGQEIGKSGSTGNSTGPHLHFEVTVNGKEVDPASIGFNFGDPSKMGSQTTTAQVGVPGAAGTYGTTRNGTVPPDDGMPTYTNVSAVSGKIAKIIPTLTGAGANEATGIFDKIQPILQQRALAQLPDWQKAIPGYSQQATGNAMQNSLSIYEAVARYVSDIQNHTGDTTKDLQTIRDLNHDIGPLVASQAQNWANIQGTTDQVKAAQATINEIDRAQTARHESERQADELASRKKTQDGWTQQLVDHSFQLMQQSKRNGWQDEANALQDRRIKEQQIYDDATTNEGRRHTLADRNLQDEIRATTKAQTEQTSGTTARENALRQLMSISSGPARAGYAENLAIERDYGTRSGRSNVTLLDTLQQASIVEQRNSEDTLYNLNSEHRVATQGFDKNQRDATRYQQTVERGWQATTDAEWTINFNRTKNDQEAVWRLQDQRNAADALDALNKANAQTELDTAKARLQSYQDEGNAFDALIAKAGQFFSVVGNSMDEIMGATPSFKPDISGIDTSGSVAQQNYYNAKTGGLKTASGVPYSQFPAPGQFAQGGTTGSDWAIVGDGTDGNMNYAEVVNFATRTVIPNHVARSLGLLGGAMPRYASGTGNVGQSVVHARGGDTYHVTIQASGNTQMDAALFAKFKRWADDRDREQERRHMGVGRGAAKGSRMAS